MTVVEIPREPRRGRHRRSPRITLIRRLWRRISRTGRRTAAHQQGRK